jgi:cell division protein YceG involved in septum cleavage
MIKKILAIILLLSRSVGAYLAWDFYKMYKGGSINKNSIIYIPTGSNYDTVLSALDSCKCIKNKEGFDKIAQLKSVD